MANDENADSTSAVLALLFILIILVLLLIYLYVWLNRKTDGQYTIQRFIFSEGGLRDRVLNGVAVLQERLNALRQSQTRDEENVVDNDDNENDKEENGDAANGHSRHDSNCEDREEEIHDDSSDDYSSIDLRERVNKNKDAEEVKKAEEQIEESKDGGAEDEGKQEEDVKNEERVGLLIDLKSFSGSAIWSEEKKEDSNITAL